ncbi:hypothetical protein [Tenuibacillus multivorans]|uniref:DUF5667 domain-containing protein n=1 Tax=Tenuibacillus multivorans TaxID=237069 RepID=A0A1H0EXR5_9BACI|nr:hypothetical protein [Tenuibacillus multivorans]GEL78848.1 hypothetical protein TMU01_30830 [Tenuibacillus multivorans]SDN87162.1 hypothetical protein SAMN05216498_0107 [Tenuibacillus multivorans]
MKRNKFFHLLTAGTLTTSLVLAPLSITADEHEDEEDQQQDVEVEEETTLEAKLFSYYVKVSDQLSLALEEEDSERLELLLDWSLQQIEEAQALYDEGHVEQADEILEEALTVMEEAESSDGTDEEDSEEEENEESSDEEENNEDESSVDEENSDEEESDDEEQEERDEAEEETKVVGQNVISLAINMEKVKNPVAKAALKRNIERSLARLEVKYDDLSALYERLNEITDEFTVEEDEDSEENSDENTEEDTTEEESSDDESSDEDSDEEESTEDENADKDEEVRVEIDREENFNVHPSQNGKSKPSFGKNKAKDKGNNGKGNNGKAKGKGHGKGPNH